MNIEVNNGIPMVRACDKWGFYYILGNTGPRFYYVGYDGPSREKAKRKAARELKKMQEEFESFSK